MSWLQSIFGGESAGITLVLIVLALAVALVLLFWIFRKIAGENTLKPGRNRQPRLSVTDAAVVDDKRRLVLVRRDDVEHLVMIGGPSDIVIEQNIARAPFAAAVPQPTREEIAPPAEESEAREPLIVSGAPPRREDKAAKPEIEPPQAAAAAAGTTIAAAALQRQEAVAETRAERETVATHRPETPTRHEPADFDQELAQTLESAFTDEAAAPAAREAASQAGEAADAEVRLSEVKVDREEGAAREIPSVDTVMGPEDQPVSEPRRRSESMEDEMQRLLNELAASKPN